jgi:2-polyprenyl-3-methyl-5-hydroxy-6-metoxy-1,4-benzoquinol methylase
LIGRWRFRPEPDDPYQRLRPAYTAELAAGTERFFEPRRSDCPWCGCADLTVHLVGEDLIQGKPGRFTLERCGRCEHIFQNPRLSPEGLDFYYRDCYDGLGAESTHRIFASNRRGYQARAAMLKPFTTPKAWLDVGAGHGHFCNVARDTWPETVFDGLDMSQSIEEAQRCRWIDHGHRGLFPELAGELVGRYDVISMHHYLEHTREPFTELDAAAKALPDGGYLLIEQPNPESYFGRVLGRHWLPWFQPQHQHMIKCDNLTRALEDRAFTTVLVERGETNQACDLTLALALFLRYPIDPRLPWLPHRPTPLRRAAHTAKRTTGLPLLLLANLIDRALHQITRRTQGGDTYRILARKDG